MKAIYVFFACISILFAVGCSNQPINEDVDTLADAPVIDRSQESGFHKLNWPMTLDSFSSNFTRIQPGSFVANTKPASKLSLIKGKDSITFSGVFHLAYQDKQKHLAYHSYHFYLKAGLQSLEAFFKEDLFLNDADENGRGLQKVAVAEKGYHLNWGKKA